MATQIQLSENQIQDLQVLRDLGVDTLTSVVQQLDKLTPSPLSPDELFAAIKSHLQDNEQGAECVMRQALSLNGMMRQTGMEVDAVLSAVRSGIERDANWEKEEIEKWTSVESSFRKLICSNAFRLVAKTIDLSYNYANLFRSARILTDIRPLFNEDADAIDGAVVSCTLRLRFDSGDGEHGLSIAMDEGDVRDLSEECMRALKKAKTARKIMSVKVEIPTIISGERVDAS